MQRTLKSNVKFTGIGLHSGKPVHMTVKPASVENGIWFNRTDEKSRDGMIFAGWQFADGSPLCTRLVNDEGVSISTIEHLMAAFVGCGITNAIVDIDGPEVPILDGSAIEFVRAFLTAGTLDQNTPVRAIRVLKSVEVTKGDATARLDPSDSIQMDFEIDFADAAIGRQSRSMALANGAFVHELCDSRTFCRNKDVDAMRAQGLALGGTMDNAIVVDGPNVLNPTGLRHSDEPVRHKMLDAMGDLALAGGPIFGAYKGHKAGHAMTNQLLRALFADPSNFEFFDCDQTMAATLPGAGVTSTDLTPIN